MNPRKTVNPQITPENQLIVARLKTEYFQLWDYLTFALNIVGY